MTIGKQIKIFQIVDLETSGPEGDFYSVVLITGSVKGIIMDGSHYTDVSHSLFFLNPKHSWTILKEQTRQSAGYIMQLSGQILNAPMLSTFQGQPNADLTS